MRFADRRDAGRRLAPCLSHLRAEAPVVLALPRGGVPVAYEVARALAAPLDVVLVRKLGAPGQPELAMGALGEGGVRVLNDDVVRAARVRPSDIERVEAREQAELERRAHAFRGDRAPVPVEGRTVVVVDDGIATGSTALAALQVVRARGARRVVLATPVAPPDAVAFLRDHADEVVVVEQPTRMFAIGTCYDDFTQTTDDEVVTLLRRGVQPAGEINP
jgi:predicted phosphoribosyltransferase